MKRLFVILWAMCMATVVSAQGNYQVRSGDTLQIEVLEDAQLNRAVLVTPDGRITFPFVGSVQARGRTVSQIQRAITSGISSNFAAPPNVFVSVASLRPRDTSQRTKAEAPTIDVYFLGEMNSPGLKAVAPGTTFLQAMAQHGGFTKFAAQKRVQLRRTDARTGQQTVFQVNYRSIADGATLNEDITLQDGDVILVPERRLFE
jgi:polysaccharide export outer membrane protein